MLVATWNVNNVVRRLDQLLEWLARTQPDVVALQELKAVTEAFPAEELRHAGYESLVVGQKTWNGVALLSRHPMVEVVNRLPGEREDKQARYIEAAIDGILFGCLYLPNGNPQPGPKFDYKLRWFERLRKRAAGLWASGEPVVLLGDWNVVPTDADIYKPDTWRDDALLQPEAREAFAKVLAQGWTDAIAKVYAGKQVPFTFWDYRRKRWERDAGLRIDHILVSEQLDVVDAGVDKAERGKDGPSDHAPVWAELKLRKARRGAKKVPAKKAATATKGARVKESETVGTKRPKATPELTGAAPDLSKAVKAALPAALAPQLATLASAAPAGGEWVVEGKLDGYRAVLRFERGKVRIITRNGNDWTAKLKPLAAELETLGIAKGWLDGEMVVLNEHGVPDFNGLQNAIDNSRSQSIILFLFDVPFLDGQDLREVPLRTRRAVLQRRLEGHLSDRIRFSEELQAAPADVLNAACQLGMEGVMLKRADAPYRSGRTDTWLKLKCQQRQEFVVVGFTDRTNASKEVGNLTLGYYDQDGELKHAGAVGTGWNTKLGAELHAKLVKLEVKTPTVDPTSAKPGRWSKRSASSQRWVKPQMVVEVAFAEWTPDGSVRHATFKGLRTDKPAKSIRREQAVAVQPKAAPMAGAPALSVKVSHPERVIDKSTGMTKLDLVSYYDFIAPWLLPHLKDRPVSLVRAPQGIEGQLFFQKHSEAKMPGMTVLDTALWPGHDALLAVNSKEALLNAAQLNCVEFHSWNSKSTHIDQPDRVIFDLDPGVGVTWAHVQEAARLVHGFLDQLGLQAWLKTSGGKGLHVVVPLAPKLDYDSVKAFSQGVVQHIAEVIPQRFVAKSGGSNRVGKIFIDYLRNGHGQTTAAAFSARARPGLGVSMPISWDMLEELKSGAHWTIRTAPEYMSAQQDDPWKAYWRSRQTLTKAMKALASAGK